MLAVNEEFYSVQGEGIHTGIPMYFVRLQGCSVGCYFCDVKQTWKRWFPNTDEAKIAKRAKEANVQWVCITGGEPYEQPIYRLIKVCKESGLKTHIETCGAFPLNNSFPNWLCLSPKDLFSPKKTLVEVKKMADEIKVIVTKPQDLLYYLENYHRSEPDAPTLIIQPVDTKIGDKKLLDYILQKTTGLPNIRIMIQQQKAVSTVKRF